jgi:hypothetical protein
VVQKRYEQLGLPTIDKTGKFIFPQNSLYAKGGRVHLAYGSNPNSKEQFSKPEDKVNGQKIGYDRLRNSLPPEIDDKVIKLLASSTEALHDFGYIQTVGDIAKFNNKYAVDLKLPANISLPQDNIQS